MQQRRVQSPGDEAEEVARDEEIRRQVQAEFPPAAQAKIAFGGLSQALKDALRASDKSSTLERHPRR